MSWDLRGIPESIETVQKAERMGVKNQNTRRRRDRDPFTGMIKTTTTYY